MGRRTGTPISTEIRRRAKVPGVAIVRVEGGLFFANAEGVAASIRAHANDAGIRAVVLDGESISFVDSTAVSVLVNTARQLDGDGVRLVLAHDIGQVRDLLQAAEAQRLVDVFYPTVQAAVDAVTLTETTWRKASDDE